jgi:hypothetical protein
MSKNTYWIADDEGTRALVEGIDARDRWTQVHGWSEAAEPDRHDFVWLRNEDPQFGPIRMTWEAAQLPAWSVRGWVPGAPPEPVNPATAHWPVEPAAAEPPTKSSPAKASATSGDKKE